MTCWRLHNLALPSELHWNETRTWNQPSHLGWARQWEVTSAAGAGEIQCDRLKQYRKETAAGHRLSFQLSLGGEHRRSSLCATSTLEVQTDDQGEGRRIGLCGRCLSGKGMENRTSPQGQECWGYCWNRDLPSSGILCARDTKSKPRIRTETWKRDRVWILGLRLWTRSR